MSFRLRQIYKPSASQQTMSKVIAALHCLSQPTTKCCVIISKEVQGLKASFPPSKMVSTMKTVIAIFYLSRVRANSMTTHLSRLISQKVFLTSPKAAATKTTAMSSTLPQKTMQLSQLASQFKS